MTDFEAMALAIKEAKRGVGFVSPNPLVGCVVLSKSGDLLASGYHARVGGDHAEIDALKKIDVSELKDARVFVTLEPCAHEGRTPSCAKKLATLPIQEVVYGLTDPNPLVAGKGARIVADVGIKVKLFADLQKELQELCEHFLFNQIHRGVFVSLKTATSLDGKMMFRSGESKWITGAKARGAGHFLRASHDAVGVGYGTLKMDNPELSVRLNAEDVFFDISCERIWEKKGRVVLFDPRASFKVQDISRFKLFSAHQMKSILLLWPLDLPKEKESTELVEIQRQGLKILRVPVEADGFFDLVKAMDVLFAEGIYSLLVEGGPRLVAQFLKQRRAQKLYSFIAPLIMGADATRGWSEGLPISNMKQVFKLRSVERYLLNQDTLIYGDLEYDPN